MPKGDFAKNRPTKYRADLFQESVFTPKKKIDAFYLAIFQKKSANSQKEVFGYIREQTLKEQRKRSPCLAITSSREDARAFLSEKDVLQFYLKLVKRRKLVRRAYIYKNFEEVPLWSFIPKGGKK